MSNPSTLFKRCNICSDLDYKQYTKNRVSSLLIVLLQSERCPHLFPKLIILTQQRAFEVVTRISRLSFRKEIERIRAVSK